MKKALLLLLTLVLCLSAATAQAVPAPVATAQQDGIRVTLTTDKAEYEENERIHVTLKIVNTTDHDVKPVVVNYSIPNTCTLDGESGSYVERIDVLKGGETKIIEITLLVMRAKLPSTGDNSSLFLWLTLATASVFALCRMGAQNLKRLFAIVLCISMMTSMLPVGASTAAAQEEAAAFRLGASLGKRVPPIIEDFEGMAEEKEAEGETEDPLVAERRHGELVEEAEAVQTKAVEVDAFDGVEILPFEEAVKRSQALSDAAAEGLEDLPEKAKENMDAEGFSKNGTIAVAKEIVILGDPSEFSVSISYSVKAVGLPAASFIIELCSQQECFQFLILYNIFYMILLI